MQPFLSLLALFAITPAQAGHGPILMHQATTSFEMPTDSVSIPLRLVDGRIVVDLLLDGKGPYPFVFDTGAHGSVMDLSLARELNLALGREIMVGSPGGKGRPGHQVTLERVQLGGLLLEEVLCVAFDGLPFPQNDSTPRGVLAPYGLQGLLITLDYRRETLGFRRGELPEPDGREVFGWKQGHGLPEIPVTIEGQVVLVHLDSGASVGLSVPTQLADRLPLEGPLVDMGYAKTVDQVLAVRGATLQGKFVIGRYTIENPTLRFVDMAKGIGNVGAAVLREFVITIDPARSRLRLAGPADGILDVKEERKPRYGLQFEAVDRSPLRIRLVDAGSPAERSGLREGDRIIAMNGRPIGDVSVDVRLEALRTSPLGLRVQRDSGVSEVTMRLE